MRASWLVGVLAISACGQREHLQHEIIDIPPELHVVAAPAIRDGTPRWRRRQAPSGWSVAVYRDDNQNDRYDFWNDPAAACANAGDKFVCGPLSERVILRVIDGRLSEMYVLGESDLVRCDGAACVAANLTERGIYRVAQVCDGDLNSARVRGGSGNISRELRDLVAARSARSRPRSELSMELVGVDLTTASEDPSACATAECRVWRRDSAVWELEDFESAKVDVIIESHTLLR